MADFAPLELDHGSQTPATVQYLGLVEQQASSQTATVGSIGSSLSPGPTVVDAEIPRRYFLGAGLRKEFPCPEQALEIEVLDCCFEMRCRRIGRNLSRIMLGNPA
jgi:hypothetical protein